MVASQTHLPVAQWVVPTVEGDRLSQSLNCPFLRMSVHPGEGTSQLLLEAMTKLVLLRRSEQIKVEHYRLPNDRVKCRGVRE